jgi:hypothetical protein
MRSLKPASLYEILISDKCYNVPHRGRIVLEEALSFLLSSYLSPYHLS